MTTAGASESSDTLGNIAQLLSPGWVSVLVGIALFLAGAAFSYALYIRSKKRSSMFYLRLWEHVVSVHGNTRADDLEIRYKGKVVPEVYTMSYIVWNDGTELINGEQLDTVAPLKVVGGEKCEILDVSVADESQLAINARVEKLESDNGTRVLFDFLNPQDGFIVKVICAPNGGGPSLLGSVRGLPDGVALWKPRQQSLNKAELTSTIFLLLGAAVIFFPGIIGIKQHLTYLDAVGLCFSLVGVYIFCAYFYGQFWSSPLRSLKRIHPTLRAAPSVATAVSYARLFGA